MALRLHGPLRRDGARGLLLRPRAERRGRVPGLLARQLSLLNLVLFTVPLTGLVLGVGSVAGSAETLPLLLAQPVGRLEVLAGKYLGSEMRRSVPHRPSIGAGGLIVAMQAGPEQIRASPC